MHHPILRVGGVLGGSSFLEVWPAGVTWSCWLDVQDASCVAGSRLRRRQQPSAPGVLGLRGTRGGVGKPGWLPTGQVNKNTTIQQQQNQEDTTLQYVMNAKLSKHRFWHCHENGLIKTIQTIPHNLLVSVKSASLYCGLRIILVYPNPQ